MSAHSYIYVTIFYFLNYLFFKKNFFFLKMMLTYHISHEKNFSTALYVHGRSGVKIRCVYLFCSLKLARLKMHCFAPKTGRSRLPPYRTPPRKMGTGSKRRLQHWLMQCYKGDYYETHRLQLLH